MPFFELRRGRAVRVPDGAASAPEWDPGLTAQVRAAVPELLGFRLLEVGWQSDDPVLGEYLLAIDPQGAAVTVAILPILDETRFVAALARSARGRHASRNQLAARYPGGADALDRDLVGYRAAAPALLEVSSLLVLAGVVPPIVRAAVSAVRPADARVLTVRRCTVEGRSLISVEPVDRGATALPGEAAAGRPDLIGAAPDQAPSAERGLRRRRREAARRSSLASASAPGAGATATAPAGAPSNGVRASAPSNGMLAAVVELVGAVELAAARRGTTGRGALRTDGTIEVSGRVFSDPTEAASAALGADVEDGWAVWRFGPDGPFLSEARDEAIAPRPRGRRVAHGA